MVPEGPLPPELLVVPPVATDELESPPAPALDAVNPPEESAELQAKTAALRTRGSKSLWTRLACRG